MATAPCSDAGAELVSEERRQLALILEDQRGVWEEPAAAPPTTRARAPTQHGTHTFHQQQLHTGKETAFAHTAVWAFSKGRFHVTGNFECIYARTRYSILRLFLNPHAVRVVGVVGEGPSHHSNEQVAEQHLCARARATDRSCEDVHAHVRRARPCAQ